MRIGKYQNRDCFESDWCDFKRISASTRLTDTSKVCCLMDGESGTQIIEIKNDLKRAVKAQVEVKSVNANLVFETNNGERTEYKYDQFIPPNDKNLKSISVKKKSGALPSLGTIEVDTTVTSEASIIEDRPGPKLHPQIELK